MTITDDIVKGLRNPTPLYAVAGTADLAAEKLRQVPVLIEKIRATDPKAARERVTAQAKDAQSRVTAQAKDAQSKLGETFGGLDLNLKERPDLRKLGESVQDIALQGVGRAAGYAVKARETYDELAERGKGAFAQWRGEAADDVVEIAAKVEPERSGTESPETESSETKPAAAKKAAPRKPAAGRKPTE